MKHRQELFLKKQSHHISLVTTRRSQQMWWLYAHHLRKLLNEQAWHININLIISTSIDLEVDPLTFKASTEQWRPYWAFWNSARLLTRVVRSLAWRAVWSLDVASFCACWIPGDGLVSTSLFLDRDCFMLRYSPLARESERPLDTSSSEPSLLRRINILRRYERETCRHRWLWFYCDDVINKERMIVVSRQVNNRCAVDKSFLHKSFLLGASSANSSTTFINRRLEIKRTWNKQNNLWWEMIDWSWTSSLPGISWLESSAKNPIKVFNSQHTCCWWYPSWDENLQSSEYN